MAFINKENTMLEIERGVMWYHVEGMLGAFIVDDHGNLVAVQNARLVRAHFNAAFWQYIR